VPAVTHGHVLIMGHRTFSSVPDFAFQNRQKEGRVPDVSRQSILIEGGLIDLEVQCG
jgi:hypothetical protein